MPAKDRSNKPAGTAVRAGVDVAGGFALVGMIALITYPNWRPWCWGASGDEAVQPLAGDELLEDPAVVTTRAISIDTAASSVWPWLLQMGPGRGGAYTYDCIENVAELDMHSADSILPEFQDPSWVTSWRSEHADGACRWRCSTRSVPRC